MPLIRATVPPRFPQASVLCGPGEILGGDNYVISVIGDGSLTGGMAYEAMNNAARLKSNFIIVLNDNNMSISENVAACPIISAVSVRRTVI